MPQMSVMSALRARRVGVISPLSTSTLRTRKAEIPEMHPGRWGLVVALLLDVEGESRRQIVKLERLQAVITQHRIADDVKRRQWRRGV